MCNSTFKMFQGALVLLLTIHHFNCDGDGIFEHQNPLILTDYLEKNLTKEARLKSAVNHGIFLNKTSYAGYFRVNKEFNSNLFFWFFPAENNYENAPVVLWLEGGPGDTTFISIFFENGPFTMTCKQQITQNKYSWSNMVSMIYIDNPVGTGYSFTEGGYASNQTQIGEELYEALQQFFQVFPELINNNFFISGVSYGGKYAMSIGHTIHQNNPTASIKINLKGISCGNGVVDPEHEINYAEYYYQLGLVDWNTKEKMRNLELKASEMIRQKRYRLGLAYIGGAVLATDSLFAQESGYGRTLYHLIKWNYTVNYTDIKKFVTREDIRSILHVGKETFHEGTKVVGGLMDELMVSVAPWMSELLSHYKVLVYNGQLDLIVPYPITLNYLRYLNFSGADEYKTAKRSQWRIQGDLAGYVKEAGNLIEVLVRNAGHMAIHDQPAWLYDMFSKFFFNKTIY